MKIIIHSHIYEKNKLSRYLTFAQANVDDSISKNF